MMIKNNLNNIYFVENFISDFFILDDLETNYDLSEFLNYLTTHNLDYWYGSLKKYAYEINQQFLKKNWLLPDYDLIITVGQGGKNMLKSLNLSGFFTDENIVSMKWSRNWDDFSQKKFNNNFNEYNIYDKKILIIEDVIGSGETVNNVIERFELNNNKVSAIICSTIMGHSPILLNELEDKSIFTGFIAKDKKKYYRDPHWYPAFFTMRHLLFGDEENTHFYNLLAEKYFNNDTCITKIINQIKSKGGQTCCLHP